MSQPECAVEEKPKMVLFSLDQICGEPTGEAEGKVSKYTSDQVCDLAIEVGLDFMKVQRKLYRGLGIVRDPTVYELGNHILDKRQGDFTRLISLLPEDFLGR
jgi:hypothetical protein